MILHGLDKDFKEEDVSWLQVLTDNNYMCLLSSFPSQDIHVHVSDLFEVILKWRDFTESHIHLVSQISCYLHVKIPKLSKTEQLMSQEYGSSTVRSIREKTKTNIFPVWSFAILVNKRFIE